MIRVRILVPVLLKFEVLKLEIKIALFTTRNIEHQTEQQMNKISNYFKESYLELTEKVTWPSWLQLQQSTIIVLIATIIITALVWVMDFASQNLLKLIYSLFK